MTEDQSREALRIYEEAVTRKAGERGAYLDAACGANAGLRREVEGLLAESSGSADGFLNAPPWQGPALSAGQRLGPYEVVALLGAGGMGEVYRARDTRLGRDVAVKVLHEDAAADPDRLRRFEQEARAVAALNHPHICVLHDIGTTTPADGVGEEGIHYLVMECLEGQTLAARLARGPLPLPQALEIGIQIADALVAAHRAGIVHRDLKPANVMLVRSAGGAVSARLLDFGLARLAPHAQPEAGTAAASISGMLLGTAPYMSPEQVAGQTPDARADLFAFGVVLYEMLTGRRAFDGASTATLIAAILDHDPPAVSSLVPTIPPAVDHVIQRCLAKDPDARWQSASDLADELRWAATTGATIPSASGARTPRWRRLLLPGTLLVAGLAVGAATTWQVRPVPAPLPPAHTFLALDPAEELTSGGFGSIIAASAGNRTAFAWTPDGQTLVFSGRRGGVQQLYVRKLQDKVARPLPGTEDAQVFAVSSDGKAVAFWAARTIRRVPLNGGPVAMLVRDIASPEGLDLGPGGRLVYAFNRLIWQVDSGNAPKVLVPIKPRESRHVLPRWLPDGTTVLFTIRYADYSWGREQVVVLESGASQPVVLLEDAADARYVPTGHLVFLRRGQLMAIPFDPVRLTVNGDAVPVLDGVAQALLGSNYRSISGAGQFAVSSAGTLAYVPADPALRQTTTVTSVDRKGRVTPLPFPDRFFSLNLRVSPDGGRLALVVRTLSDKRVFVHDLSRPGSLWPVTSAGEVDWPQWRPPNGERLAMYSPLNGRTLVWQRAEAGGTTETLIPEHFAIPSSWSPDGRYLAVWTDASDDDIMAIDVQALGSGLQPLVQVAGHKAFPEFSPDGRRLAYTSDVSGRAEAWVQPFPGPGAARMVSVDGGSNVAWNPNGRELFFVTPADASGMHRMMAVDIHPNGSSGPPRTLFTMTDRSGFACASVRCYDVARDGQKFYAVQTTLSVPAVTRINLVENWAEELKAKVPVREP